MFKTVILTCATFIIVHVDASPHLLSQAAAAAEDASMESLNGVQLEDKFG